MKDESTSGPAPQRVALAMAMSDSMLCEGQPEVGACALHQGSGTCDTLHARLVS
jgi:hypothetical protein